jgi:PTS system nitrogen regulatory IIA component
MDIKDFLSPANAMADLEASDKSRLLTDLSNRAASALKLDADLVVSEIMKREELGSTGIGGGVALPHARIQGLQAPFGILARLREPIGFDAIDDQPVDVVFFLLLPAAADAEQLNTLACVARKLRDGQALRNLRSAADDLTLYEAIVT